jgi:hypothetical protein
MINRLLVLILLISCNDINESKKLPIKDTVNYEREIDSINKNKLSALDKVIDSLYENVTVLSPTLVDTFVKSITYKHNELKITAKYTRSINGHSFGYIIELIDTARIYQKDLGNSTEDYKYASSYLVLDSEKVNLTHTKYLNTGDIVDPVDVWYGKSFGICAKTYQVGNRLIYLIRGTNYFCNGSNCSNYKILYLQKDLASNKLSSGVIDFRGKYPYIFENVFLFHEKDSTVPKMFILKEDAWGDKLSDSKK